jgi:hypothetical protein
MKRPWIDLECPDLSNDSNGMARAKILAAEISDRMRAAMLPSGKKCTDFTSRTIRREFLFRMRRAGWTPVQMANFLCDLAAHVMPVQLDTESTSEEESPF